MVADHRDNEPSLTASGLKPEHAKKIGRSIALEFDKRLEPFYGAIESHFETVSEGADRNTDRILDLINTQIRDIEERNRLLKEENEDLKGQNTALDAEKTQLLERTEETETERKALNKTVEDLLEKTKVDPKRLAESQETIRRLRSERDFYHEDLSVAVELAERFFEQKTALEKEAGR
jgi:chromosome segregation ATPase